MPRRSILRYGQTVSPRRQSTRSRPRIYPLLNRGVLRELPYFVLAFRQVAGGPVRMITLAVFWVGLCLEIGLILRALQQGLFLRYPTFFSYLSLVALVDVVRYYTYYYNHAAYKGVYWPSQFISLIVGYGVILEILGLTLARYPGAARLARNLVLLIFLLIFAYVGFKALTSPQWTPATTNAELERDLRAAQVAVLAGILGVIAYFRIPLGKNLKGMISGYGVFLASSVITLALRSYAGSRFDKTWLIVQPFFFLICLLLWCFTLWSYHPDPLPRTGPDLSDYSEYSASARTVLQSVRSNLGKVARP
jgi:hypothetical protein